MAINLGSSPIAEIKLGSTPAEKVFLGTALVWPFLTTLSGIPPIVMLNALERYVYSLTQTGKCEQNGTPTPSAPVDIYCNNGVLKVGRETYTTPLGRTVYGGTLDVVTGELVVDRAMITLNGSESWVKSSNGNVYYLTLNASTFPYGQSVEQYNVCNQYAFKGFASGSYASFLSNGEYLLYRWIDSGGGSAPREIAFKNQSITSVTDWKALLQGNPIQVVYELATPQTYQLTPQTVEMIAERSTFQSNASGNIDITYYANGTLKTVSGNPVVIADADGQNAEDVTVHIEPIQSGSGTPSPTNIRPISGMTDINITRLGGVVVDGTPETLTVTGKNLFDISAYDDASDWTGTPYKYIAIPLQNGQYTISWDKSKGGGFYWLVQVNGAVKGTSNAGPGGSWLWHDTNTSLQKETFTFTVTEGYVYFSCSFGGYFEQKFLPALETVQIEKGSTATAYEPYSAQTASVENLLAVGNYKDEQDIISGTVKRRCEAFLYDGTQTVLDPYLSTTGGKDNGAIIVHPKGAEYSGSIVSLDFDPEDEELGALSVSVEPIQDLHGYDNPWPAGGGVNLLPPHSLPSVTDHGITLTNNNGEYTLNGTTGSAVAVFDIRVSLPAGQYTVSVNNPTANSKVQIYGVDENVAVPMQVLCSTANTTATATFAATVNIFRIRVLANGTVDNFKLSPVFSAGATAATKFYPYSNICPISGHTDADVIVSPTLNPLDGTTYHIPLGQTVYGGTLDVVTGELVVDRAMVDLGTLNYGLNNHATLGQYFWCDVYSRNIKRAGDYGTTVYPSICSAFKCVPRNTREFVNSTYCFDGSADRVTQIQFKDSAYSDATSFKTAMSGVQLVYELATPQTYQLTPQQVELLQGENNIWSNAGDMKALVLSPTTEQTTAQPIMAHAGSNTISIPQANVSDINLEVKYWTS